MSLNPCLAYATSGTCLSTTWEWYGNVPISNFVSLLTKLVMSSLKFNVAGGHSSRSVISKVLCAIKFNWGSWIIFCVSFSNLFFSFWVFFWTKLWKEHPLIFQHCQQTVFRIVILNNFIDDCSDTNEIFLIIPWKWRASLVALHNYFIWNHYGT